MMTHRISTFATLALLGCAGTAAAQDLRGALSHCLAIPGVLQRLACYDGVAKSTGAVQPQYQPQASYAPQQSAPMPPAPRYVPPSLGNERLPQTAAAQAAVSASRVVADIVKFDHTLQGRFILTLSNGQVWAQIAGDDAIPPSPKAVRSVVIEHAIMNSYSLTFNSGTRLFKVTRVQ